MSEPLIAAAEYVRMSTEDQRYSIDNQRAVIAEYARANNYEIIRTFTDHGISGLDLKHRPGLKALLETVAAGTANFQVVLVLDVSRWGRFQDIDESAYYEFLCRKAGMQVRYCAEPFKNDHTAFSNLVKAIKRTMAAEYSRELGVKVFNGQARLAALGYKQGGVAQIGFRRLLVDAAGNPKQLLKPGERKSVVADKVLLVPGPASEIRFVRGLFQSVLDGRSVPSITRELRRHKRYGRRWTENTLFSMLRNRQYVGVYIYNRTTAKLRAGVFRNPPESWVVTPGAVPAIVSQDVFDAVQLRLAEMTCNLSNEDLLLRLKQLWQKHGFLTVRLVDRSKGLPSVTSYRNRFGSIWNAFSLIGFPRLGHEGMSKRRTLATYRHKTWRDLKQNLRDNGLHLTSHSYYRYKIAVKGVPLFNFVLAHPLPLRAPCLRGPVWEIRPPRRSLISNSVIAMLSSEGKPIEYVITRALRKLPTQRFAVTLPILAQVGLVRFRSPDEFYPSLKKIGYL